MPIQKTLREVQEVAESPCLVCFRAINSLGDDIEGKQIFEAGYVHTWAPPNLDRHMAAPHGIENLEPLPPICFEEWEEKYREFRETIATMRPDQIATFEALWKRYHLTPAGKRAELYTLRLRELMEVALTQRERERTEAFWKEKDAEEERRGITTSESLTV